MDTLLNTAALLTTARWHLIQPGTSLPWGSEVTATLLELLADRLGYPAPGTAVTAMTPVAPLPAPGTRPKIALVLGHGRAVDMGNVGYGGVSEEEYNTPLIAKVAARLEAAGVEVIQVLFYPGNGYTAAMHWLAGHLLSQGVTAAVEFHFNASEAHTARGHEVLHWVSSREGVKLARTVCDAFDKAFPNHPSRGLKSRSPQDRGALFLSLTHCPAVICEPFFGDNAVEWNRFDDTDESDALADAYAAGLLAWATRS